MRPGSTLIEVTVCSIRGREQRHVGRRRRLHTDVLDRRVEPLLRRGRRKAGPGPAHQGDKQDGENLETAQHRSTRRQPARNA
jgi:hypothetical protein